MGKKLKWPEQIQKKLISLTCNSETGCRGNTLIGNTILTTKFVPWLGKFLKCWSYILNDFFLRKVQFETEGNGQNVIVNHMDRSEVKL